ncbi:hypothetical protein [Endozoicomonas lisbonensis]|uniref:hypothetical protein n=1 Tax=Endozoicomonas lisbonensis TaxID=3120522 RepID=UPI00339A22B1
MINKLYAAGLNLLSNPTPVINKAGLILAGSASLYLTAELFLSMSIGTTAIIFLLIGLAAELGKYRAIVGATLNSKTNKLSAFFYGLTALVLIIVSLAGSAGALLATDNQPTVERQVLDIKLADIDRRIILEERNMTRAADVNAQTAGVKPARSSLDELTQEKKELLEAMKTTPAPEPSGFDAIVGAISAETTSDQETVRRAAALMVALLLEGLCLFFAVANTATRNKEDGDDAPEATLTTTIEVAQDIPDRADDRFPVLVAAIQAKELKPTYDNIRQFMNIGAGEKVRLIRQRLIDNGVCLEGPRGVLVAA